MATYPVLSLVIQKKIVFNMIDHFFDERLLIHKAMRSSKVERNALVNSSFYKSEDSISKPASAYANDNHSLLDLSFPET